MDDGARRGYNLGSHKGAGQVRKHSPAVADNHPKRPEVPHG